MKGFKGTQCCRNLSEAFVAVTSSNKQADNENSQAKNDDDADIVKGLAAGFGFFFGLILLVCLVWCLCCANVCSKTEGPKEKRLGAKVSPSPPHSANVRTRPSATTSA
ncbi:hypothetical protein ACOMHN_022176 [Nucella lapillus]